MQGHPREDREWEHWPGRRAPDDGIRHRLKALFAATDDEEAVEALIAERGREIEEQTERLQATIEDLERREEQAGRLRSAVEEMLRHGSAELDERHAELAALALDLRAREEKVREQERDIAVRKQELGAVELRRAAVERREAAAAEREAALEQAAAELRDRERRLADAERGARDRRAAAALLGGRSRARGVRAHPVPAGRRLPDRRARRPRARRRHARRGRRTGVRRRPRRALHAPGRPPRLRLPRACPRTAPPA